MKSFKEFLNILQNQQLNESKIRNYDQVVGHMYQNDLPILAIKQEIEQQYGPISFGEIYRALKRVGITTNRRQKPGRSDVLYFGQNGVDLKEISKITGYSTRQVRNILKNSTNANNNDDL